jgi:hypothetical protein
MATLERSALPQPLLPQENVLVEALGGEVIVRGMDMEQQLRFSSMRRRLVQPQEGETADQAAERAGGPLVPLALSWCVVLADGQPAYSEAEWRIIGAMHPGEAISLFNATMRLSGQNTQAEKKS